MGRIAKLTPEQRQAEKDRLYADVAIGGVPVDEMVRRMRRITGMTQADYARKVAGISPQALAQIEQGRGNPTVETLNRLGRAFGLQVGFVRRPRPPGL